MDKKKRKKKKKKKRASVAGDRVTEIALAQIEDLPLEDREYALEMLDDVTDGGALVDALYKIDYKRRPVDIEQFLDDPFYMGRILYENPDDPALWPVWRDELLDFFGPSARYQEWILGGSIGSGKTTCACIAMVYIIYMMSCLRNPLKFYGLMHDALIVFGIYSVTKTQAADVAYGKIRLHLETIPYFKKKFAVVKKILRHTTFTKNKRLQVLSGSRSWHVIGKDMFAFLLDEGNFFQQQSQRGQTKIADAQRAATDAYKIYQEALMRMKSRFLVAGGSFAGAVFMISSKTSELAFLEEHIKDQAAAIQEGKTKLSEYAIWDVKPKRKFKLPRFQVEIGDETYASRLVMDGDVPRDPSKVIDVPGEYLSDFQLDVEQALRDHAGVSTIGVTALIKDREAIQNCVSSKLVHPFEQQTIVCDYHGRTELSDYFNVDKMFEVRNSRRQPIHNPRAARFAHIDIGVTNDAAGIVVGHVADFQKVKRMRADGTYYYEEFPVVWIDLMLQVVPRSGGEIGIQKLRQFIIYLRATGLPIISVSADGYQSTDTLQILSSLSRPFVTQAISTVKTDEVYCSLRQAVYEDRVKYYDYPPFIKELRHLVHDLDHRKVDHPQNFSDGSKASSDVSDGVASVTHQCVEAPNLKVSLENDRPIVILAGSEKEDSVSYDVSPKLALALDHELARRKRSQAR